MKLLLDTNIIVDILSKRDGYLDSLYIFQYCEARKAEAYITTTTITDVIYILRKYLTKNDLREAVQNIISIVEIISVLKSDIISACTSNIEDFEDAVQVACAKRIDIDYIITRNTKDFQKSSKPVLSPADLLAKIAYYSNSK
jgi:predicted nucleic acid-binding protein